MSVVARPDVSHYTYRVSWSVEDGEFVASCLEFPSLSWLAASQVEALEGLVSLLRDTLADLEEQGEEIPATRLFVPCQVTTVAGVPAQCSDELPGGLTFGGDPFRQRGASSQLAEGTQLLLDPLGVGHPVLVRI
jgi:predicted RNase H-like HicB family nuclease